MHPASLNIERAAFEDRYVYRMLVCLLYIWNSGWTVVSLHLHTELVIGLTSGALLVCIAFPIFTILCSYMIWRIRRKHTSFICDGKKDPSAVDMVVYDVPVFTINSVTANKENALQNSMIRGDMIINQNVAYDQVCKKT